MARAVQDLGSQVLRRAAERLGPAVGLTDTLLGESEVGQAHVTFLRQQNVLGLQIATRDAPPLRPPVHDAHLVQVLQRQRDLRRVEARTFFAELLGATEMIEQLAAGTVVQHEVQLVLLRMRARRGTDGLEGELHPDDEWMIDLAENVALRLGVLDLVLLLDHRLIQHLHGVDLALAVLSHLEHLAEAALPDHLQDLEVADGHRRIRQLGVLIAVIGVIAASGGFGVEGFVIAEKREVDFLNTAWRMLCVRTNEDTHIRLGSHELLKGIHVLNILILHDLHIAEGKGIYGVKPVFEENTNRIDPLKCRRVNVLCVRKRRQVWHIGLNQLHLRI